MSRLVDTSVRVLDWLAEAGRRISPIIIPVLLVAILTAAIVGAVGILQDRDDGRRSRQHIEEILENQEADKAGSAERLKGALDFLAGELARLDAADQERAAVILHNQDHIRQEIAALRREVAAMSGRPGPANPTPAPAPPGLAPGPHHP